MANNTKPTPPTPKQYGFHYCDEFGWSWNEEGAEEAYETALEKFYDENRCPECLEIVGPEELKMFGGICEQCNEQ